MEPVEIVSHAGGGAISLAWLMIALPLAGAAILLIGGRATNKWGHLLAVLMSVGAFVVAALAFFQLIGFDPRAAPPVDEPLGVHPGRRRTSGC